jgi:hypothetical protein
VKPYATASSLSYFLALDDEEWLKVLEFHKLLAGAASTGGLEYERAVLGKAIMSRLAAYFELLYHNTLSKSFNLKSILTFCIRLCMYVQRVVVLTVRHAISSGTRT